MDIEGTSHAWEKIEKKEGRKEPQCLIQKAKLERKKRPSGRKRSRKRLFRKGGETSAERGHVRWNRPNNEGASLMGCVD